MQGMRARNVWDRSINMLDEYKGVLDEGQSIT